MTDVELASISVDADHRIFFPVAGSYRHVGWLDREVGAFMYGADVTQWRARTTEGSSLGVFSTRDAAIRAIVGAS